MKHPRDRSSQTSVTLRIRTSARREEEIAFAAWASTNPESDYRVWFIVIVNDRVYPFIRDPARRSSTSTSVRRSVTREKSAAIDRRVLQRPITPANKRDGKFSKRLTSPVYLPLYVLAVRLDYECNYANCADNGNIVINRSRMRDR